MRLIAPVCVAGAAALAFAGCESTVDEAKKISAKGNAAFQQKGLSITHTSGELQVVGTTILTDQNGSAVVISVRNKSKQAMINLPISINVTDQKGTSVFKNDAPGLEHDLDHIPLIMPGQVFDWINDQVLATGTPAKVTPHIATGGPLTKSLPPIHMGPVSLQNDPTSGRNASATVRNQTQIAQYHVVIFVVARKGAKIVAAGRAIIQKLLPGKSYTWHAYFIGNPTGAQL